MATGRGVFKKIYENPHIFALPWLLGRGAYLKAFSNRPYQIPFFLSFGQEEICECLGADDELIEKHFQKRLILW